MFTLQETFLPDNNKNDGDDGGEGWGEHRTFRLFTFESGYSGYRMFCVQILCLLFKVTEEWKKSFCLTPQGHL